MSWHMLAFAAIPVWIWAILAGLKQVIEFAEYNDDRWWGGFPLWAPALLATAIGGSFVAISIGFYAATGLSPFS